MTHWKRPWCWERLRAGGAGDDRGWDGWMASPTQWTWVWVDSRSWWWTGRPGVLRFIGSQRVGHDWVTELNWIGLYSPQNSPGQNTGADSCSFLQWIFPIQGLNPGLLHCRWIVYQLSHKGNPRILEWVVYPFSSGSSQPRNQTGVSSLQVDSLPAELWGKPHTVPKSLLNNISS